MEIEKLKQQLEENDFEIVHKVLSELFKQAYEELGGKEMPTMYKQAIQDFTALVESKIK